jgi:hypothetical protein
MKTFAEFLTETWTIAKGGDDQRGDRGDAYHYKKIHGHDVDVNFMKYKDTHEVMYSVNGAIRKRQPVTPEAQHAILHHVHKRIDQFVRHAKPKKLIMSSGDDQRIKLHSALTQRLAKRYGGKAFEIRDNRANSVTHVVHFKRG